MEQIKAQSLAEAGATLSRQEAETAAVQRESIIVQHILQDANLETKVKDYVKNMVAKMKIPLAPTAAAVQSAKLVPTGESTPGQKGKKFSEADMKRVMEEVALKERKRYEEGNKLLISKIEQLKKQNSDLTQELDKQKETTRILESVSTNPVSPEKGTGSPRTRFGSRSRCWRRTCRSSTRCTTRSPARGPPCRSTCR